MLLFWWRKIDRIAFASALCLPPQDMFCLYTPGGGGYGSEGDVKKPHTKRRRLNETFPERGSVFEYRMAQEGVWTYIKEIGRGRWNRQIRGEEQEVGENKGNGGFINGWENSGNLKLLWEIMYILLNTRCRVATEL